jgi:lysylphosphatidylglycerol synthetase-like protein (DUF2156 family)
MDWIFPLVYFIGWFVCARIAYGVMLEEVTFGEPDSIDRFLSATLGMLISIFWPLIVPIAAIMWHPKPTAAQREREIEKQRDEIARQQRRIKNLEYELGIK